MNFYPIRLVYLSQRVPVGSSYTEVLFTVSKKKFKSAVTRNAIKRRMREAYRLHKHLLGSLKSNSVRFLLRYIYMGSRPKANFGAIQTKIVQTIDYLRSLCEHTSLI